MNYSGSGEFVKKIMTHGGIADTEIWFKRGLEYFLK